MITVFLGAPGTGKGTIATLLKENNNFQHVSTGDLFRDNIKNNTDLGIKVKSLIAEGKLIDDELTFEMLIDKLKSFDNINNEKIILDGFPRTINQANLLKKYIEENNIEFNLVLNFDVSKEIIIDRLSSRMFDPETGKTYNKNQLPDYVKIEDLQRRPDDEPENIEVRFQQYEKDTKPLINYYENENKLIKIDASQVAEKIKEDVLGNFN